MAMPSRRFWKRVLLGVAVAPPLIVVLALSALALPLTRRPIVKWALELTNEALDGIRIECEAVERLDLWGVELRGVRVFDAEQRQMVSVRRASARIAPLSLLSGGIRLPNVEIAGARVAIYPSPPEPEEEEPDSEPSTFQVLVERATIADAALDMELSGRALHATIAKLVAGGAYGPRIAATIHEAQLAADLDGQRALALRTTHVTWENAKGGRVGLAGELLGATLALDAQLPALDADAPWPVSQASLSVRGLTSGGLARVGLADAAQLRVPVDLSVRAQSQGEQLTAELELTAGQAKLALTASAEAGEYSARVRLAPAQLSALSGLLPELRLGVDLHADLRADQRPMPLELEWRDLELDGRAVPQGALSAALDLPNIELKRLGLRGLENALRLRASYDLDRAAGSVALETSALELAAFGGLVPVGLHGTLDGGLDAKLAAGALKADAALSLRGFGLDDLSIEDASVVLKAAGPLVDPRGQLALTLRQIRSGETTIDRVSLSAQAGVSELSGKLSVAGADRQLALDVLGKRRSDGSLLLDAQGSGTIKDKRLGLKLVELQLAQGAYSLRELSAFSGRERISASGGLDAQKRLSGELAIQNLELASWTRLFLDDVVSGTLDATVQARGTLQQPGVEARISLRALHAARAPRAPPVDLKTALALDAAKSQASLELDVESADRRVLVKLAARAALARRARDLVQGFERARYEAELSARSDVPFAAQFAGDALEGLDGNLQAALRARGTLDEPELDAELGAQLSASAEGAGARRDQIELKLALGPERADAKLGLRDRRGELLDLRVEAELPKGGPRALAADHKRLLKSPAKAALRLNERRLDKLEGALGLLAARFGAALPLRTSAELAVSSTDGTLAADLHTRAHLWSNGFDPECPDKAGLDAELKVVLKDEQLRATLQAAPSAGGKLQLELNSKLAASQLLAGGALDWGPASVRARAEQLGLHSLPKLCTLPEARTRFTLAADDVGKGPLRAQLELAVEELRLAEGPPVAIELRATSDASALKASGGFKLGGTSRGWFQARVPLAYSAGSPAPTVASAAPLSAALSLPEFPLSGLTSFTGAVGRAGGTLRADLKLAGTLSAPEPSGYLELHDAAFSIAALAQPFSHVNGRFELSKNKLTIQKLSATDRSGKLSLKGYARYAPGQRGDARVYLSVDKFPLRQQGSIVGELSTRAEIEGKLAPSGALELDLELREGRIWLTGEGGRQVQALDDHPDVRIDQERELAAAESAAEEVSSVSLSKLRIHSDRGLWLQHEDFAVQVGVDIQLNSDAQGVALTGEAKLVRGELALLGKPFDIKKGAVRFTGDVPPDPELDITAKHKMRNGQELAVQVQGRASAPQIVFSGAASNAGEAALLLTGAGAGGGGGGKAGSNAARDAANFASGLTAGLLAVSARRKFGNWVPMLAIENNASGVPSGARAGFDASNLIPKFMQGFAKSMYVEGVVGSRVESSARTGFGVRVELALPQDFVTALGYGPGTTWSTDVYWSP
jgi:autotransporter translocation and assembly factor TamB